MFAQLNGEWAIWVGSYPISGCKKGIKCRTWYLHWCMCLHSPLPIFYAFTWSRTWLNRRGLLWGYAFRKCLRLESIQLLPKYQTKAAGVGGWRTRVERQVQFQPPESMIKCSSVTNCEECLCLGRQKEFVYLFLIIYIVQWPVSPVTRISTAMSTLWSTKSTCV